MASKKASSPSPVSCWMAADSAGEVSGPVAMMTLSHSAGGSPATSPRSMLISGWPSRWRVTSAENRSRSTASAPPAGSLWRSPAAMISERARRISSCSRPTALVSASSERNELEHTSSASPSVLCASVCRTGRISCSTTGTPASATCQAASDPASPPPTIWMGVWGMVRSLSVIPAQAGTQCTVRAMPLSTRVARHTRHRPAASPLEDVRHSKGCGAMRTRKEVLANERLLTAPRRIFGLGITLTITARPGIAATAVMRSPVSARCVTSPAACSPPSP